MSAVVSDSSPLNYLALLSDFDLLRQIYGTLLIPPAIHREVVEKGANYPVGKAVSAALGKWISVAKLRTQRRSFRSNASIVWTPVRVKRY